MRRAEPSRWCSSCAGRVGQAAPKAVPANCKLRTQRPRCSACEVKELTESGAVAARGCRALTQRAALCAALASTWESRALRAEEMARTHLAALTALVSAGRAGGVAAGGSAASTAEADADAAATCSAAVEALRRELSAVRSRACASTACDGRCSKPTDL